MIVRVYFARNETFEVAKRNGPIFEDIIVTPQNFENEVIEIDVPENENKKSKYRVIHRNLAKDRMQDILELYVV